MVRVSPLRAATARRPAPVPCDIKFKLRKFSASTYFVRAFTLNCGESSGGFTNSEQKKATKSCACTMRRSVEKMFSHSRHGLCFCFAHFMVQIHEQIYEFGTINGF